MIFLEPLPGEEVLTKTASDGYLLRYRLWDPPAPQGTALLLHGVMSHSAWFRPLVKCLLLQGLRVIGADRRGSGINPVARGDAPAAATLLDDFASILEANSVGPRHLIGWCWGAVPALALEPMISPGSLILLAPGLWPTPLISQRAQKNEAEAGPEGKIMSPITEDLFSNQPTVESEIRSDPDRLLAYHPRFRKVMGQLALGALKQAHKGATPTLLVLAEDDQVTDNGAAQLGLKRPHQTVLLPGAHGLMFDAPEALGQAVTRFVFRS